TQVQRVLEARRGGDVGERPGLELLLDERTLLLRHRAVVRTRQHGFRAAGGPRLAHELSGNHAAVTQLAVWTEEPLVVDLVEAGTEPLGEAAGVREDDRRPV